jgi:pimeloyl-ACP methyl ester carboxylesterase
MTTASATPFEAPPRAGIVRGFARVGDRQLHFHRAASGPPVVCFHASPPSAEQLLPVTRQLARSFTVLAFDTPGYASSDPVPVEEPRIEHYAEAVAQAVAGLDGYPRSMAARLRVRHRGRRGAADGADRDRHT